MPRAKKPGAAPPASPAAAAAVATPAAARKPRKRAAPKAASADESAPPAADAPPPAAKKPRVRAPRAPKGGAAAESSDILNALPDESLTHVLSLLPMDERARAACASRRLRALVAQIHSVTISLEGVTVPVYASTLGALMARAGPSLRVLDLYNVLPEVEADSLSFQDAEIWLLPALRDSGCTGIEELRLRAANLRLNAGHAEWLLQLCPRLRRGHVRLDCNPAWVVDALAVLPGVDRALMLRSGESVAQLAAALTARAGQGRSCLFTELLVHPIVTFNRIELDLGAFAAVLDALAPTLRALNISDSVIGDAGVATAARLLHGPALRELRLWNCGIGPAAAVAALAAPRLQVLALGGDVQLRDDTGALGAAVGAHPALRELILKRCDLSAATAASLGEALEATSSLRELHVSHSPSFRRGTERFFSGLERNRSLLSLLLEQCALGAAGARAAARAVARQGRLQRLSLLGNELLDDGAAAIAALLTRKACTLQHLNLESNGIQAAGGVAVAAALGRNASLRKLVLSENPCGSPAMAKALAAGLAANTTLQTLELCWLSLSGGAVAALARAVGPHPALRRLDLSFNDCGDAGARALAAMLERPGGCRLHTLLLSECSIGPGGARAFAKALRTNNTLRMLALSGNDDINQGAFTALRNAFYRENTTLRRITLGPELPNLDRNAPPEEEW